jgi:hypothetical protein
MTSLREKKLCFSVTGKFLTDLGRKLWADDQDPEKALDLLKTAFPDMPQSVVMSVLLGEKKLTGDSNIGIEVEDDNQSITECGHDLGLKSTFKRLRDKIDMLEDRIQMAEHVTEFVPSPKGMVEVPSRRTTRYEKQTGGHIGLKADIDLEKIPHRKIHPLRKKESMLCPARETERANIGLEVEVEPPLPPPPDPQSAITQDEGWLSPEGKFYPCAYGEHINLATRLGLNSIQMEKTGWLKVQQGKVFFSDLFGQTEPTQSQRDKVFDYYMKQGQELPSWMKPEDN